MASQSKQGGQGGLPLNLNTILALTVVIGGAFYVSSRLTSQRPAASIGSSVPTIGEQTVDSRLWEDPLAFRERGRVQPADAAAGLVDLRKQIARRLEPDPKSLHVLFVSIPGGPYSEDRESRIRSRFAVVSALGQAGYAPTDAEHIGMAGMPWPTSSELKTASNQVPSISVTNTTFPADQITQTNVTSGSGSPVVAGKIQSVRSNEGDLAVPPRLATNTPAYFHAVTNLTITTNLAENPAGVYASGKAELRLAYEWFRYRTFAPRPRLPAETNILVLWVDDDLMQDQPLDRTALLINSLSVPSSNPPVRISVIGPRRSSTLRTMLPNEFLGWQRAWPSNSAPLVEAKKLLSHVTFYSATASAIDEVLVLQNTNEQPRLTIRERLQEAGVSNFLNFVCTDAQLASNALAELKRRKISLIDTNQNLVLVGEWDTFYGRTLSLTYAAELLCLQKGISRSNAIEQLLASKTNYPKNLIFFNYLRGLDGQTFNNGERAAGTPDKVEGKRRAPKDISDLSQWTPDENKAEGSAQLDYLFRLGHRIEAMENQLRMISSEHRIAAIAVLGSDPYDTLLILQALRSRFQGAVFFTTDLDARLWHPQEFAWTRGLVVVSSFGLQLADEYQGTIPSFRDSVQTAQYAATLSALGVLPQRPADSMSPRIFEVARRSAVDLSPGAGTDLHPPSEHRPLLPVGLLVAATVFGCVLAILLFRPVRDLFLGRSLTELCWMGREDVGDLRELLQQLQSSTDPLSDWLRKELCEQAPKTNAILMAFAKRIYPEPTDAQGIAKYNKARAKAEGELINFLNERINGTWWAPADVLRRSNLIPTERKRFFSGWREWLRGPWRLGRRCHPLPWRMLWNRREVNMFLDALQFEYSPEDMGADGAVVKAIKTSRHRLTQWLARAGTPGEASTSDELRKTLNVQVLNYPWAPRQELLDSDLVPEFIKARYSPYVHYLRKIRVLPKPDLLRTRTEMDTVFQNFAKEGAGKPRAAAEREGAEYAEAAAYARKATNCVLQRTIYRMLGAYALLVLFALVALPMILQAWAETCRPALGEPFSLVSGISVWPTEFMRLIAIGVAFCFLIDSYTSLRIGALATARRFRMSIADNSRHLYLFYRSWPVHKARVDAAWLWKSYQQMGAFWKRMRRAVALGAIYFVFGMLLMRIEGFSTAPLRGEFLMKWDLILLMASVGAFLLLTFWTIDAALLCRWFIEHLSFAPTQYPRATLRHFQLENGDITAELLDEWIDTQLIAELTERIGRLVYYPSLILLVLLISRNSWWELWPWPWALIVIYVLNLLLAVSCILILQKAAIRARNRCIASLDAKLKSLRITIEKPPVAQFNLGEQLLEDVRSIRRGAFVPFWENPAVGAILVPSGGVALLELFIYAWAH
jgi:hypothetical protein